jgi:UDP-2,3-diacylglucosamine pyrophosphatase LpxH
VQGKRARSALQRGLVWLRRLLVLVVLRLLWLRLRRILLRPTAYRTAALTAADIRPGLRRIVISDIHLGAGDRREDFFDDEVLAQFIDDLATGVPTELILAGDSFEFLQVSLADLDDDQWSNAAAARRLTAILQAHPQVTAALARLLAVGTHQLTILIGNHDFELHYPAAKQVLAAALQLAEGDGRLRFATSWRSDQLYIVHGNQFDRWNRFIHFDGITEPFEAVRGTRLVKEVINELEDDPLSLAPLLDNVKPTSAFLWYMLGLPRLRQPHARSFTIRGLIGFAQVVLTAPPQQLRREDLGALADAVWAAPLLLGLRALQRERLRRGRLLVRQVGNAVGELTPDNQLVEQLQGAALREMRRQIRRFQDEAAEAVLGLAQQPEFAGIRYFVCGHTHGAGTVPLGGGKSYFNVGTWTDVIYDLATMRREEQRRPYLEVLETEAGLQVRLLVRLADGGALEWRNHGTIERRR